MRKLVFASVASAAALVATPAMARDDAWYLGIDAGALVTDDLRIDGDFRSFDVVGNTNVGFDGDVVVGHDFGYVRVEAEGGYKHFGVDQLDANWPAWHDWGEWHWSNPDFPFLWDNWPGWDNIPEDTGPPNNFVAGSGVDVWSGMVNALADIGDDDSIGLSFGGGIGIAKTNVDLKMGGPDWINTSDTNFAWQLLAEARIPVSKSVDVGLKYRYFNSDVSEHDLFDHDFDIAFKTHSLMASLIFNFGGPGEPAPRRIPPPPPPVARPAPPPPPPPPVAQCNRGPYIVFFDWDKSDITPEAATILDSAVVAYGNCGTVPVMLAGYTDRSGSEEYNVGLAGRRNASVRGYLTSRGVPDRAISSQAFGEANPRVPTADGVRELQNRRVEISYGPGSGR